MDRLRSLLRQRVRSAMHEAARSGGKVADEELADLERAARLLHLQESLDARGHWIVIAVVSAAVVVFILFLTRPLSTTEIDLAVSAGEASFVVPQAHVLLAATGVTLLGVTGLRRAVLPRDASDASGRAPLTRDGDLSVRLATRGEAGSIDLAPIDVPARTRVTVAPAGGPNHYRVSLTPPPARLRADVQGVVLVDAPGEPQQRLTVARPGAVELEPGAAVVDLDLTLREPGALAFVDRLPAADLAFVRVEQFDEPTAAMTRRVSTVRSGTIELEDVGQRTHRLRTGEGLTFHGMGGIMRALTVANDGVALEFHGDVHAMTSGWGEKERNLMPTWVEWLAANQRLTLIWGAILSISALVVSVLRWWRSPS